MPIDLQYDDADSQFAASVRRLCGEWEDDPGTEGDREHGLDRARWMRLGDLGVLGLTTPEGGGSAATMAAVMEELGRGFVRGPLVATFAALQLLPDAERGVVASGDAVVTMGTAPLVPWAPVADLFVELHDGNAWLSVVDGVVEPVATLAGEPWGRCALRRGADLGSATRAAAFANCALAAYLTGAGLDLLEAAAAYARDRSQFGRVIGDFQAIAHPLGQCSIQLNAASVLTKLAADALVRGATDASRAAATARVSASKASLTAAYQAHQTFGAMGFAEEGPVGARSALIRQLTLLPPAPSEVRDAVLAGLVD